MHYATHRRMIKKASIFALSFMSICSMFNSLLRLTRTESQKKEKEHELAGVRNR